MKTFATAILLSIGLSLQAQDWTLVSPLKWLTSQVNNIVVTSPSTIYLTDFSLDYLLKSTDGGLSFKRMGFAFNDNPGTLWMFNDSAGILGTNNGNFYKTTNGFLTRTTISTSVFSPKAMVFLDNNLGYTACNNGSIFKTTNGGNNWTAQTSGTTNALKGLSFVDANTGFACGNSGTILKTTNGGQNWQALNTGSTAGFNDILFANAQKGWVAGLGGTFYRTLDGGNNWSQLTVPTVKSLNKLYFINNNLFVACDSGILLQSSTEGLSWSVTNTTNDPLLAIGFHSSGVGFVGGERDLHRSLNFGQSWTPVIKAIPHTFFNKLSFANNNIGVAVGYATTGGIFQARVRTVDGGLNWTTQSFNTSGGASTLAVHLRPDGVGLYGGGNGNNAKTTDLGASWSGNAAPNMAIRAVWAVSPSVLIVGGGFFNSGIFTSFNGGNSWTHFPGADIYDFHFPSTNIGYAVGGGGTVRKTTDGGFSWTTLPNPLNCDLISAFFLNDTLGYVSCGGNVAKTTNGGQNWMVLSGAPGGTALQFFSPDSGYSIFGNGAVYKTVNGGTTWTQAVNTVDQTDVSILDAAFLSNGRVIAVGALGDIFTSQLNCQLPIAAPSVIQWGNTLYSTIAAGNQWYNASGPIAGATGHTYTPTASGTYYVIRTNGQGCVSAASNSLTVSLTALNNLSAGKQALLVYPNPAQKQIWVKIPSGNKEKNLLLINSQGQVVRSRPVTGSGTVWFQINRLPAGIYWVKIGNAVGRVVVE